ncbi:SpoIIE family protein phosphatase [Planosporangium thailandense]|uniref:SpoIIE family protein phosphatase n=1 Tax=Planosporangium thailandense TaxID=765197 RepID=A0ABX0XTW1_9ACTN|nr:SpoIIE family protein phosphatase [Planosporangium thailandense]NJC68720.1 SpoIIE family protein phosphatase [Planosporangium thailandense]
MRLPADHSSPGAARAAVRSVLAEAGLTDVLDEALLLTTELATNAVVHARTSFDVEVTADADTVTVTVMDFHAGPITHNYSKKKPNSSTRPIEQLEERGRGLLLVDQLATYWGTLHYPDRKGVWFRLDRAGAAAVTAPPATPASPPAETAPPVASPSAVLGDTDTVSIDAMRSIIEGSRSGQSGDIADFGEKLLGWLCAVLGAEGGAILVDRADGRGMTTLADHGAPVPGRGGLRVPINVGRPWRGELVFTQPVGSFAVALPEMAADRLSLMLENDRLRYTDNRRRTWLTYLAEVSELLAQSLDTELTLALIPRLVVPRLGRWCAVHVADGGGLRLAATAHTDESATPELQELLAEALPQLDDARQVSAAIPLPTPINGHAVAMSARGQALGVLSVGHDSAHRLDAEELAIIEDVARRAALAIDNARIHAERRRVAEALQRSLLPPKLPQVEGIDFGAEYVPTGEGVEVGGDFYDVMGLDDGRWLVVVGDVSGKGVHAATVTGLVREVTRTLVCDGRPLPEALGRLNETLVERGNGRFCTLALAAVTPRTGGRLDVSLYLAGHDRPVLLHTDGRTSLVGESGTALGLLKKVSLPQAKLSLARGETLIFYTDGVTERRRGAELYGVERLRLEASSLAGFPADVVAARLRAATLSFSLETPRDDIAIFAVRNDEAS